MRSDSETASLVHLYLSPMDPAALEDLLEAGRSILSQDELARLRSLRHPERARRFLLGRTLMRRSLAAHTKLDPAALEFSVSPSGKPDLMEGTAQGLAFSLSHARDRSVVAVTAQGSVGVDIEPHERYTAVTRIAGKFFAPEELPYLEGPDASRRAIMLWTLKESVVKSLGATIWDGLSGVRIAVSPDALNWLGPPPVGPESDWTLAAGQCGSGHVIALALNRASAGRHPLTVSVATLGANENDHTVLSLSHATGPVKVHSGSARFARPEA